MAKDDATFHLKAAKQAARMAAKAKTAKARSAFLAIVGEHLTLADYALREAPIVATRRRKRSK
ncbi:MAG: hypothetical protein ACREEL_11975 [Stellaceae bacterium]